MTDDERPASSYPIIALHLPPGSYTILDDGTVRYELTIPNAHAMIRSVQAQLADLPTVDLPAGPVRAQG